MVLTTPSPESDGPDRNRTSARCRNHHTGARTGISDYCCCCNPCLYRTIVDTAAGPTHCCRCNPQIISVKFTPDDAEDSCCRSEVTPMFGESILDSNEEIAVRYSGSIVGYSIQVFISTNPVGNVAYSSYDEINCRWTISIPELDVLEEIEIDHQSVTCLGVPSITISGVSAFGGSCTGSISLLNYEVEKVPFQIREFDDEFPDNEGLAVPLNYPCNQCEEVARILCVAGDRGSANGGAFVEFIWDTEWEPQDSAQGMRIGRWTFDPNDGGYVEKIYLVEGEGDYYPSDCMLYFDFKSPDFDTGNEDFDPIVIDSTTGCGCDFKETVLGGTVQDPLGFTIRAGRCGCREYYCGTCRCVPKYLCGFYFINNTYYTNLKFTWNSEIKGWISSGGVDIDGNSLGSTLTVYLRKNETTGDCQLEFEQYGYTIPALSINCGPIISGTLTGPNADSSDAVVLNLFASFDDDCTYAINCTSASPCADDCGSHPQALNATLYGYNDPDLDEPGIYDECLREVPMFFWQQVNYLGGTGQGAIELLCGYKGYYFSSANNSLRELFLDNGVLTQTKLSGTGTDTSWIMDYEICDPYIAEHFFTTELTDCPWGEGESIQRAEIEIIEA